MGVKYTCAACEGDFESNDDWGDAEATAEKEIDFPGVPMEQCAVVCHDCWLAMFPQKQSA